MFPGKFFLATPVFEGLLGNKGTNELQRFQKFWLAVHQMLIWFELTPALESVKIMAIALTETQKVPFSVRIQHHFKVTTLGANNLVADNERFAVENLPFEEMGNGVFELTRNDPDVMAFLRLVNNPETGSELELDYRALVAKLGFRMDGAFEPCSINHDVGLPVYAMNT